MTKDQAERLIKAIENMAMEIYRINEGIDETNKSASRIAYLIDRKKIIKV